MAKPSAAIWFYVMMSSIKSNGNLQLKYLGYLDVLKNGNSFFFVFTTQLPHLSVFVRNFLL